MGDSVALTFVVTGMHCNNCGMLIDDALEEIEGVERSDTDSRRGRTIVRADPTRISADAIVDAIRDVGYGASLEAT